MRLDCIALGFRVHLHLYSLLILTQCFSSHSTPGWRLSYLWGDASSPISTWGMHQTLSLYSWTHTMFTHMTKMCFGFHQFPVLGPFSFGLHIVHLFFRQWLDIYCVCGPSNLAYQTSGHNFLPFLWPLTTCPLPPPQTPSLPQHLAPTGWF